MRRSTPRRPTASSTSTTARQLAGFASDQRRSASAARATISAAETLAEQILIDSAFDPDRVAPRLRELRATIAAAKRASGLACDQVKAIRDRASGKRKDAAAQVLLAYGGAYSHATEAAQYTSRASDAWLNSGGDGDPAAVEKLGAARSMIGAAREHAELALRAAEDAGGVMANPVTGDQFKALQGMYDYFNRHLWAGKLGDLMINMSRGGQRTMAFFAPNRWTTTGPEGQKIHEISLNPTTLMGLPTAEIASTLVHEMAHMAQQQFGKPSRGGYHNKEWAMIMRGVGLEPVRADGSLGVTGQSMSHRVVEGDAFWKALQRMPEKLSVPFRSLEAPRPPSGVSKKAKTKFSCPGCGQNAWGKPGLHIVCGACPDSPVFEPVE